VTNFVRRSINTCSNRIASKEKKNRVREEKINANVKRKQKIQHVREVKYETKTTTSLRKKRTRTSFN